MYLIRFSKGPNSCSSTGFSKGTDNWELLSSSSGNFTPFFLLLFFCPFFLSFFFFVFFRSSLVIGLCGGSGVGVGSDVMDDCCKPLHRIEQKFWCFSANLGLEQRLHFLLRRSPSFSRGFASTSVSSGHPSQNSLCLARKADRKHFWHFLEGFVCWPMSSESSTFSPEFTAEPSGSGSGSASGSGSGSGSAVPVLSSLFSGVTSAATSRFSSSVSRGVSAASTCSPAPSWRADLKKGG